MVGENGQSRMSLHHLHRAHKQWACIVIVASFIIALMTMSCKTVEVVYSEVTPTPARSPVPTASKPVATSTPAATSKPAATATPVGTPGPITPTQLKQLEEFARREQPPIEDGFIVPRANSRFAEVAYWNGNSMGVCNVTVAEYREDGWVWKIPPFGPMDKDVCRQLTESELVQYVGPLPRPVAVPGLGIAALPDLSDVAVRVWTAVSPDRTGDGLPMTEYRECFALKDPNRKVTESWLGNRLRSWLPTWKESFNTFSTRLLEEVRTGPPPAVGPRTIRRYLIYDPTPYFGAAGSFPNLLTNNKAGCDALIVYTETQALDQKRYEVYIQILATVSDSRMSDTQKRDALRVTQRTVGEELFTSAIRLVPIVSENGKVQTADSWIRDLARQTGGTGSAPIDRDPVGAAMKIFWDPSVATIKAMTGLQ